MKEVEALPAAVCPTGSTTTTRIGKRTNSDAYVSVTPRICVGSADTTRVEPTTVAYGVDGGENCAAGIVAPSSSTAESGSVTFWPEPR